MELTQEQIQQLHRFTEKKYVRWYDLQVELVDHLASKIEEEMSADASLGFDAALEKVYKSFGLFGFAKVVQEKEAQVSKAANRMWWKEMRSWLTWPKAAFTAFVFMVLWQLSMYVDVLYLSIAFVFAYLVCNYVLWKKVLRTKARKNLVLLQLGPMHFSGFVLFYEFVVLFHMMDDLTPFWFSMAAAVGILIQVASFQLYLKVRKQAMELYPEAFDLNGKVA